jgi:hypothetical protein
MKSIMRKAILSNLWTKRKSAPSIVILRMVLNGQVALFLSHFAASKRAIRISDIACKDHMLNT